MSRGSQSTREVFGFGLTRPRRCMGQRPGTLCRHRDSRGAFTAGSLSPRFSGPCFELQVSRPATLDSTPLPECEVPDHLNESGPCGLSERGRKQEPSKSLGKAHSGERQVLNVGRPLLWRVDSGELDEAGLLSPRDRLVIFPSDHLRSARKLAPKDHYRVGPVNGLENPCLDAFPGAGIIHRSVDLDSQSTKPVPKDPGDSLGSGVMGECQKQARLALLHGGWSRSPIVSLLEAGGWV